VPKVPRWPASGPVQLASGTIVIAPHGHSAAQMPLPILVTPLVAVVLGQTATWAVTGPIAVITVAALALLTAFLRAMPAGTEPR
jgi:hypothetical protein